MPLINSEVVVTSLKLPQVVELPKVRKVLLTTFGSYGDLHPYLAMARALKSRGDEVSIATHPEYRDQVERLGVRFVPMKPGFEELGPDDEWAAKANHSIHGSEFIIRVLIMPYLEASYETIKSEAATHDLIISHVLTFAAPIMAEELRIPWISTALQPSIFFSAYDPPALGFLTILPRLKFLGPRFMRGLLDLMAKATIPWQKPIGALRARIGLPASTVNMLTEGFSPYGTLALFPRSFASAKPDWPGNVHHVGFPLFDEETTRDISEGLRRFLDAGDAPVVFTLGSAVVRMQTNYYEVAYQAVKKLGMRAVLLVGKNPHRVPAAAMSDPNVHVSDYEPFSGLFPRAEIVVHQCGVGTTSQALASGRPQILVPFAHDQPDNARRVAELGCGVVVSSRRLSVSRLVAALRRLKDSPRFAEQARQVVDQLELPDFNQRLFAAVDSILSEPVETSAAHKVDI